jgi:uncharacterized protein (TIGR00297 family)
MVLSWELAAVGALVTGILAAIAVAAGALTPPAGALAAAFGVIIVTLAGFPYLALLVLFVLASSLATRYRFDEKRARQVQEGRAGERGVSNVVAHILIPTGLVLAYVADPNVLASSQLALLYGAAIAFAAADTFASEFGVLSPNSVSILTLRPVAPGTNGGVSLLGELWAFLGATTTAVVGLAFFALFGSIPSTAALFLLGAVAAGFLACQIDSILGMTLENRGLLTKGGTNFLAMLSAVGIGAAILTIGGHGW